MSNTFTGLVRVGSDPEVRFIPSGKSVLNFSAASSTGFGDKKQTLWLRVTYWNNPEKIAQFITKGDQLVVSGELSQREYQANDGTTKTSLELNANILDLVGKPSESQQGQSRPQQAQQRPQQNAPRQQANIQDFDDTIPF